MGDDDLIQGWADAFEDEHEPETGWIVAQLLDYKTDQLGTGLRDWTTSDLEAVLLDLMPRRSSMDDADIEQVVPTVAAFLRWLGRTGRVRADVDPLAVHVEGLAGPFKEAMRDPANWGMAKSLFAGAGLGTEQLGDPRAMQQAMERFNALPFVERDRLLGPSVQAALPPARIAPAEELDAAAREAVLVRRVTALVDWLGHRRVRLTEKGNLRLADARELLPLVGTGETLDPVIGGRTWKTRSSTELRGLDQALWLAVLADFVVDDAQVLVRQPAAALLSDRPRDAAAEVFDALLRLGAHDHWVGDDTYGLHWYADLMDQELALLPLRLYPDGEEVLADLAQSLWDDAVEGFGPDATAAQLSFARESLDHAVQRTAAWLVDTGCAVLDDGALRLTRLGVFAVQRRATAAGIPAPVVGALCGAPVEQLLHAVVDLPEDLAAAELDAWVSDAGPGGLTAGMPAGSETARGLAFRALLRVGRAADEAVLGLADDPAVSAYAQLWRVDAQLEAPEPVTETGQLVDVLSAVVEVWGAGAAGRWVRLLSDDPGPLVDAAWRVPGERAATVLAALGDADAAGADKALAKRARKALFKLRTSR
ncbi:MAG TPA: hypothetical protein VM433_00560 [Mycobacteriales bacterium]|nr:hypothetical protein [Mycobacteriales bacterium]